MATQPARRCILSIDGGGIRCLMAIEVLQALEARLAELTGDPNRRLHQHCDLVAGTSGGALIGTAVALGLPMREIRDFVLRNAPNMFQRSRWYRRTQAWYDKSELERNVKEWFGADTRLGSDRLQTLLMLVMRNWSTDSPWLVSNNPHARFNAPGVDDCNLDLPLWQLARASAAVPGFYAPETIRFGRAAPYDFIFLDGGLTGFLNPAFKAFQYVTLDAYGLRWPVGEDRLLLVSVGSGDGRHKRTEMSADALNLWRALSGVPDALLQSTVREQDVLCRTFGRCKTGEVIDMELGDLRDGPGMVEPRLFTYHRLDVALTRAGLDAIGCAHVDPQEVARFDAVSHLQDLSDIGRGLAARTVDAVAADMLRFQSEGGS